MLSVCLLWPGMDGYAKITAAKYRLFLILTLAYCAGTALLYLELLVMRQLRFAPFREFVRAIRPAEWLMLGYVLCSLLSSLLSPWQADTWLGLGRREGFLTLALYAAVYLEEASQTYLAALATGRKVEPLDPEMVKAELGEPDSWANYLQK